MLLKSDPVIRHCFKTLLAIYSPHERLILHCSTRTWRTISPPPHHSEARDCPGAGARSLASLVGRESSPAARQELDAAVQARSVPVSGVWFRVLAAG